MVYPCMCIMYVCIVLIFDYNYMHKEEMDIHSIITVYKLLQCKKMHKSDCHAINETIYVALPLSHTYALFITELLIFGGI